MWPRACRSEDRAVPNHPIHPEIHLVDGNFYADDPYPHYKWMRANAPVYRDPTGDVWGLTLHDDIMAASKDSVTFCNRHGMRPDSPPIPSMINMDDPDHKRRRALVNKGFTPRRVAEHEPKIRGICRDLIARVASRGECDFVRDIAAPLPMIMIGDMLGVEPEDRDDLLRWSDEMLSGTSVTAPVEVMMRAAQAFEDYSSYHRRVVADRRGQARDDLVSILLHAEIDGEKLDDEEILQESLLILIGGDETTRHVITGGMEQCLRHPDQYRKLVEDPRRIPVAVEEMLRWVTPIKNMARTATRDVEVRGETIREGDKVLLLYPSANRDERIFPDADRFDVERNPNPHVAFGGYGAHFCLGASLARLELRVMFEELVAALPDLELATDDPLPLRPSNFVVGIEHMPVRFRPR
jgi:cytochrome P450 family 142 subfamily A polypeptide 1